MTVRDIDRGADALRKRMLDARVSVGVQGQEAGAPKTVKDAAGNVTTTSDTVVDVATQHEFGIGVPRRSFIADYVDQADGELREKLGAIVLRVVKGSDLRTELELLGLATVGGMQARISAGIPPELSEMRKAQKGSSVPLIDTGQLRSSITHKVMIEREGVRG